MNQNTSTVGSSGDSGCDLQALGIGLITYTPPMVFQQQQQEEIHVHHHTKQMPHASNQQLEGASESSEESRTNGHHHHHHHHGGHLSISSLNDDDEHPLPVPTQGKGKHFPQRHNKRRHRNKQHNHFAVHSSSTSEGGDSTGSILSESPRPQHHHSTQPLGLHSASYTEPFLRSSASEHPASDIPSLASDDHLNEFKKRWGQELTEEDMLPQFQKITAGSSSSDISVSGTGYDYYTTHTSHQQNMTQTDIPSLTNLAVGGGGGRRITSDNHPPTRMGGRRSSDGTSTTAITTRSVMGVSDEDHRRESLGETSVSMVGDKSFGETNASAAMMIAKTVDLPSFGRAGDAAAQMY